MFSVKPLLDMPRWEAGLVAIIIVALMGYVIIALEWVPHMAILAAMICLLVYGLSRGVPYNDMQSRMVAAVGQGMGALYLFFFIGLLVTALMISGAIPTLMYYGFGMISPAYFYFSAFALSSLIGISLGSSLTTCATVGVAFMGMAHAFHAGRGNRVRCLFRGQDVAHFRYDRHCGLHRGDRPVRAHPQHDVHDGTGLADQCGGLSVGAAGCGGA